MAQNFKRALLVFKSIFICNKRVFKPALFAYVGIITVLCIIDIVMSRNGVLEFNAAPIGFGIINLLILVMFPVLTYFLYHDKLYVTTSYMLPASIKEKFFVPLFVMSILTPVLLYGIYVVLISLFGGISELINNNTEDYWNTIFHTVIFNYQKESFVPLLLGCIIILAQSIGALSIMLFGKFYILAFLGFFWSIQIIFTMLGDSDLRLFDSKNGHVFMMIIMITVSLLFWTISYLKFRKLQTKK